ncbi:hypothetical protein Q0F98_32570 [Paenibacillus amylolyticus]|nr:hypothetical protein Q0F98_32570 [Paenibacillus amylolyticus]
MAPIWSNSTNVWGNNHSKRRCGFTSLQPEELFYRWDARDSNPVLRELSSSPYLLSLYAYMKDSGGKRYGLARISYRLFLLVPDHAEGFTE